MTISTELNKATPTNFELIFPLIPDQTGIAANTELILNIHSVILPALSINPIEADWQGTRHKMHGTPMDFEIMSVQFNVDASFRNWKLLYNWMVFISNGKDKMAEFHDQYAIDTSLKVVNNFNQNVLAVRFAGMWPTNIQEVSFSYKEGEVLLESGVTFVYDYFEVLENI
jgi:hypothetical protein